MGWRGPLTHRQALAWRVWIDDEWNRPDRADYYAMQTACEARRVLSKKPAQIKLKHFRLKFGGSADQKPASRQQAADWAKAKWVGAFAPGTVKVVKAEKDERDGGDID